MVKLDAALFSCQLGNELVKQIALNNALLVAATNNNVVHSIDMSSGRATQKWQLKNEVVGVQIDATTDDGTANQVLYTVDRQLGCTRIDMRSAEQSRALLLTIVRDHVATACSLAGRYLAVATATQKERKQTAVDQDDVVYDTINVFDTRQTKEAVLTLTDSHSDAINALHWMDKEGRYLLSGGADGLVNIFDTRTENEDDAIQSTMQADSSVYCVGSLQSGSFAHAVTDDNKCVVFKANAPDDVDTLYKRNVVRDRFMVDVVDGADEERPAMLIESDTDGKLFALLPSLDGKKADVVASYQCHTDVVRCVAWNEVDSVLVSGGEDGRVVGVRMDARPHGGGASSDSAKKDKKNNKKKKKNPY